MYFRLLFLFSLIACGDQNANFTQQPPESNIDVGDPTLELSAEALYFVDVESGIASAQTITLTSTGDSVLEVSKLDLSNSSGGLFYIEDFDSFSLNPSSSKEVTVLVTLNDEDFAFGELQIRSNDADYRDQRIPLCANKIGYEITDECDGPE